MGLFDLVSLMTQPEVSTWTPQAPPCLDGITEIELDVESDGLRWWAGDRPIGFAVALPGEQTQYLPFAHRGGGNLDEVAVKRWAQRELRGKRITNLNTKFDVHMLREWGVDLEAQACEVSDVAHYAALLDDHRGDVGADRKYHGFSLESIVEDYLPDERKVTHVDGRTLDTRRMSDYHAGAIAIRAEADVRQVQKLKRLMWPMLDAQNLQCVRALEDQVIFAVCEMERNGTLIDVDLLDRWLIEIDAEMHALARAFADAVGFQVNPRSPDDMIRVFEKLHLKIEHTKDGKPSFTADILKATGHPTALQILRWKKLSSVKSKSLVPYARTVDRSTGLLRYALHQLRAQKDEHDEYAAGTVSGRFSSTKIIDTKDHEEGMNIQQVIKPAKQRVSMGFHEGDDSHDDEIYIVRRLHVPQRGQLFISADAMQIEYRLFADYTRAPRLMQIYADDPMASFHRKVHAMLLPYKPDLTYRRQKDVNFAKIYNAGVRKMAWMLDYISAAEFRELSSSKWNDHGKWRNHPTLKPKIDEVLEINRIYDREIPEARPLTRRAMHTAMPFCNDRCKKGDRLHRTTEHRGYVCTILGRRSRFPDGDRIHKALNTIIQGGAADIMKQKLVELHAQRRALGLTLRYTVHDEVDGCVVDREAARRVAVVLNRQSFLQLKVPILWETSIGANWAHTENI